VLSDIIDMLTVVNVRSRLSHIVEEVGIGEVIALLNSIQ
jgi:hypothetical protein